MDTYATTKEPEKKTFKTNSRNGKQSIGIEVTFIIEKKFQKIHFLAKIPCLLGDLCVHFETLLGWECTYLCHN